MDLIAIHKAPSEYKDDIKNQCCEILNDEWPRSETLRLRSLNSSRDDLPLCLALVEWFQNASKDNSKTPCVLGHVRLARIPSKPSAVWIESVVIHPDLRGKGFGKYLMLITEKFAKDQGFVEAYLCTIDRQIFYSRCGYTFCDPVCAYSGNIKLPSGLTASKPKMNNDEVIENKNKIKMSEKNSNDSINNISSNCDLTVPLTTDSELDNEVADLAVTCAKLFCRPSFQSAPPENLEKPLRSLTKNCKSTKVAKDEICRATVPKDYMKKKL